MSYNESLLHYVWKFRLYSPYSLETTDGLPVEVIDPGIHNLDAGPDFFNAKIKIGDKYWAGNIEIHRSSEEWIKHGHHSDNAYNSVILHLSERIVGPVINQAGQLVPQCKLSVPSSIQKNADYLMFSHSALPCGDFLSSLPDIFVHSFLSSLAIERLERKTSDIETHLDRFCQSWDDVLYVLLSRNFGFGLNGDAFERLALSLPLRCIERHTDSLFQVEALLFGQSGLLEEKPDEVDDYYLRLSLEYRFLKNKYSLSPLEGFLFKRMRIRPRSFPEIRIAQLAALLQSSGRLFSRIVALERIDDWISLFDVSPSDYWHRHYSFGKLSPESNGQLGSTSREVLLINTVAPILFAYGRKTETERYCELAVQLLESLKPERNVIVGVFYNAGLIARNAFDTQALIQLRKAYCDPRKCLYCRIGHSLLSSKK